MEESNFKLSYFNVKGVAEPARYIFAYVDVPFKDERLAKADWLPIKESKLFQKLPILEVNGQELDQSISITRYIGKRYGLSPADLFQEAQLESFVDDIRDLSRSLYDGYFQKTPEAQKNAEESTNHFFIPLEKTASKDEYFCGDKVMWVDVFFAGLMDMIQDYIPDILKPFPNVAAIIEKIKGKDSLKEYIANRPAYDAINE